MAKWCKEFLPVNIEDGLIEVVATVDKNPEVLKNAQKYIKIPGKKCYTNLELAFNENKADFCTIVVSPSFHENVVGLALYPNMCIYITIIRKTNCKYLGGSCSYCK